MAKKNGFFKKNLVNVVSRELTKSINRIGQDARNNAPTDRIREAIQVVPAKQMEDGVLFAAIFIKLDEEAGGAPEARAYEYGSGIHSPKGDKYPISPKNSPMMVFYWKPPFGDLTGGRLPWLNTADGTEGLIGFSTTIMHPGVAARPYLRPAFDKEARSFKGKILQMVKTEIGFAFVEKSLEEE